MARKDESHLSINPEYVHINATFYSITVHKSYTLCSCPTCRTVVVVKLQKKESETESITTQESINTNKEIQRWMNTLLLLAGTTLLTLCIHFAVDFITSHDFSIIFNLLSVKHLFYVACLSSLFYSIRDLLHSRSSKV